VVQHVHESFEQPLPLRNGTYLPLHGSRHVMIAHELDRMLHCLELLYFAEVGCVGDLWAG